MCKFPLISFQSTHDKQPGHDGQLTIAGMHWRSALKKKTQVINRQTGTTVFRTESFHFELLPFCCFFLLISADLPLQFVKKIINHNSWNQDDHMTTWPHHSAAELSLSLSSGSWLHTHSLLYYLLLWQDHVLHVNNAEYYDRYVFVQWYSCFVSGNLDTTGYFGFTSVDFLCFWRLHHEIT